MAGLGEDETKKGRHLRLNRYYLADQIEGVDYYLKATGDRWFVPVNSDFHGGDTPNKTEQVEACNRLVGGNAADDGDPGLAVAAS